MKRSKYVVLTGMDAEGYNVRFSGHDMLSIIWQHEMDHLDGKLIIDNMTSEEEKRNRDAIICLKNKAAQP